MNEDSTEDPDDGSVALCASCDRCRSRKTKCDGQRPCGNCLAKYMKKNKLSSGFDHKVKRRKAPKQRGGFIDI
jgi:hypothetical protein